MVGLVLVSHSRLLAEATEILVRSMSGNEVSIAIAAGCGENHQDLGTDTMEIFEAVSSLLNNDGVLILMDMGSAILSTEMALDFLEKEDRKKVKLCPCPFVEGAVAAGVASKIGSNIKEVYYEASSALKQKTEHISVDESIEITNNEDSLNKENLENYKSLKIIIPIPNGLHARPVANLIQEASKFKSEIKIQNLSNKKDPSSIKSMTGIVALEALYNNEIELLAFGDDSDEALKYLEKCINEGLGDDLSIENIPTSKKELTKEDTDKKPIGISKGIVIGKVIYPKVEYFEISKEQISDAKSEISELEKALTSVIQNLRIKSKEVSQKIGKEQSKIFDAQVLILEDPELIEETKVLINTKKQSAAFSWNEIIQKTIETYKSLNDDNLRQRAADLKDVSNLVLNQLGIKINDSLVIPNPGIIITDDLIPSQVTTLDKNKVLGIICLENGETSHSSILLRSRGIPSIVKANRLNSSLKNLPDSTIIAFNGESGEIWINPNEKELKNLKEKQISLEKQTLLQKQESLKPATTTDSYNFKIYANVGNIEDSENAVKNGAEGIGLLRTEFMFLNRKQAPNEKEQIESFKNILSPMKDKPITIRTLDAGGDKEIPYLNMPKEENPFLGVRAIRLCLRNKKLFQEQLRSILRISSEFDVRIMFPMISRIEELKQAKIELEKAHNSLLSENINHKWPIQTGMMMEVPSSAIIADEFAKEVDFMSIGTNDLIQYTMAADRGNPELQESLGNELPRSVLKLIENIIQACKKNKIEVAVCGEAASKIELASILLGLGIDELSMNAMSIPEIKYWIRNNSFSEMQSNSKNVIS